MQKKSSFTLVELMVAVSIFSIGIVMVLRSFLNSQDLLEAAQNKLAAIRMLDTKMSDLEEKMKEEVLPKDAPAPKDTSLTKETAAQAEPPEETEEAVMLGNRKAALKTRITFPDKSEEKETEKIDQAAQEAKDKADRIKKEIELTLSWKEGAKDKDEVLAQYFENKK